MGIIEAASLTNGELARFFLAIVLLLAFAHLFGHLFHQWRLPRVIGEIGGGLLLGPTVFGLVFPEGHAWIFYGFEEEGKLLSMVSWLGLVLLMFISGFEIEKSFARRDIRTVCGLLVGATAIPFLAGWFAPSVYDFSPYLGVEQNMLALKIVIAIAVAVTSIPVISKVFLDLGIIRTRFAKIVLATAMIQDVVLWIALAIATGIVASSAVSFASIIKTVGITIVFFLVLLAVAPRVLQRIRTSQLNIFTKNSSTGGVLAICFLFAAVASILNVNVVFGALLAGIVIGLVGKGAFEEQKRSIKEMSLAFFIPLYFALVGIKLDLIQHFEPWFFIGFLVFTTFFEALGTIIASLLLKYNWRSSLNFGIAMNTRGGPGIVLATVAFDLGIINQVFFVTLVLIAIVTSLGAGWWFRYTLSKGDELVRFPAG